MEDDADQAETKVTSLEYVLTQKYGMNLFDSKSVTKIPPDTS